MQFFLPALSLIRLALSAGETHSQKKSSRQSKPPRRKEDTGSTSKETMSWDEYFFECLLEL